MPSVITMPRLSPTMEEGVLLKWTKKEGDHVSPGEVIAEVETDKANMDFPLEDEGTLLKLLVKEGDTVKLGAPVALLGEPGEKVDESFIAGQMKAAVAAPSVAPPPAVEPKPAQAPTSNDGAPAPTQPRPIALVEAPTVVETRRPRASPVARKLAHERGIDLREVHGSGPGGRVVKRDVDTAESPIAVETRTPTAPSSAPQPLTAEDRLLPLSPMRRTIARRLTEAKASVPHFYVTMDARADALWEFWQQVKDASDVKITLNDLVLRAVAVALSRVPEANTSWSEQGLVRHGAVHLGVAVSIEDGLVTPVIKHAGDKTVSQIAREARDLIERARSRKLRGDEFTGSTFSVSNMGMLGVKAFSAVINPPDSGILAVGAVEKRAVVITDDKGADRIEARRVMTLTLSADHRAVDGALAARLLGEIVKTLERPFTMVI